MYVGTTGSLNKLWRKNEPNKCTKAEFNSIDKGSQWRDKKRKVGWLNFTADVLPKVENQDTGTAVVVKAVPVE